MNTELVELDVDVRSEPDSGSPPFGPPRKRDPKTVVAHAVPDYVVLAVAVAEQIEATGRTVSEADFDVLTELSREVVQIEQELSEEEERAVVLMRFGAGHEIEAEFDEDGRGHADYVFKLPQQQAFEQIAATNAVEPILQPRRHVGSRKRTGRTSRTRRSGSRGSPERPRPPDPGRPRAVRSARGGAA